MTYLATNVQECNCPEILAYEVKEKNIHRLCGGLITDLKKIQKEKKKRGSSK